MGLSISLPLLTYKMGFTDLVSNAGATMLNSWLTTRSYINGYAPSQADVAVFKALSSAPDSEKFPHASRWYNHIATFESEFATLPGDASKSFEAYGPEAGDLTLDPAKAPEKAAEDDDDVDLFGRDDETDMAALEAAVRGIEKDGLVWGASKLAAVGFGIKKLQINLVVEDEKISTSDLQEEIEGFEDYVQSTDVVAMQKL